MNKSPTDLLVYLDHNVLDQITKENLSGFKSILKKRKLTPVFSNENLAEIQRSEGYEHNYLRLLKDIKAKHIVLILDAEFKQTGKAELRYVDPFDAYTSYLENIASTLKYGHGFSGTLLKYYGGLPDESFKSIRDKEWAGIQKILQSSIKDFNQCKEVNTEKAKEINNLFNEYISNFNAIYKDIDQQLDGLEIGTGCQQFEDATGIGPINLKNIKGPDIVIQVWEQIKNRLPNSNIDIETFFGTKKSPWENSDETENTLFDKVIGVYSQLNFLGYYRDKNMKAEKRFNASFSDAMHAGMAAFCHVFFSLDKNLFMKSKATYEHLGIQTKVCLIQFVNKTL